MCYKCTLVDIIDVPYRQLLHVSWYDINIETLTNAWWPVKLPAIEREYIINYTILYIDHMLPLKNKISSFNKQNIQRFTFSNVCVFRSSVLLISVS